MEKKAKLGRPLKFGSVKELQERIDNYFESEEEQLWTVTGLAMHLDTFRDVLLDYQSGKYDKVDRDFSSAVKKAKTKVQNAYERDLRRKGRSGDIFALKNFGWSDKQEIEHTGEGISLNVQFTKPEEDEKTA